MKDKIINYLNENIISYVKENKFKILIPIVLLLISTFEFIYFYKSITTIKSEKNNSNILNMNIQNKKENIEKNESQEETQEFMYVDIKGEVKNPNVYKMKVGSRVNDLINEAGGLTKNANTRFISLSKILEDENTIVIYSNKEISDAKRDNKLEITAPCICEEVKNDACYNDNTTTTIKKTTTTKNTSKIININTASVSELTNLSGIGEIKAKSIVNYRNKNGKFKTINDILKVDGISETLFSKIKNNITV